MDHRQRLASPDLIRGQRGAHPHPPRSELRTCGQRDCRARGMVALSLGLAATAGATDVLGLTQLGGAFASVMTGNLVLLAASLPEQDGARAIGLAIAVGAWIVGVALATAVTRRAAGAFVETWSGRVLVALGLELAILVALLLGWAMTGGTPHGGLRELLLALATLAMGTQTGSYRSVPRSMTSTTYFTGTLAGVVAELVAGRVARYDLAILAALAVGAVGASLLVATVTEWAPALPVALLVVVLAGAWRSSACERRDRLTAGNSVALP